MDIGANDTSTSNGARLASLSRVLGRSEHVKALVAECAEDLVSVNGAMTLALTAHHAQPGLADALGRSAALAAKLQAVSVELAVVNRALDDEIRDRSMVDLQFAAAQEQGLSSRHAALHDVLTGLPNRALFNDRLDHGLAQARRQGWTLAVMFVDLDDFKVINDKRGRGRRNRRIAAACPGRTARPPRTKTARDSPARPGDEACAQAGLLGTRGGGPASIAQSLPPPPTPHNSIAVKLLTVASISRSFDARRSEASRR